MTKIYERLSRIVAMLPATGLQMSDDLGVTRRSIQVWLRHLRAEGVVGLGPIRGRDGRVYVRGDGRTFRRDPEPWLAVGVVRYCAAWKALARRCTTDDVAEATGVGRRAASEIARSMRAHGLVRIAGWAMRGQTLTPQYDRLPARDVPRPAKDCRVEVNARHWEFRRSRPKREPLANGAAA